MGLPVPTYYFKEIIRLSLSQGQLSTETKNDQRTLMRADERAAQFKAWRLGSGQRMTREEAQRTSSLADREEKTTDQKDLSNSRKLCWRKNKRY
ncbi:hypothetical protein Tco_1081306 [Tanacetum coccineum]|uniref:Uncharacterized protein n=1 Tax=Tanacetum coccineum TaxID=301880 RepID=A0ABQ5HX41_9ASTR